MPAFNFDDSEAVERQLLPPDWYTLEVESVTPKEAQTGRKMISVLFRVVDGDFEKQPLFQNFMLSGQAGGLTKSFLRAATGDPSGGSRTSEELIGCRVQARLIQKVWKEEDGGDGELQNNIVKFRSVDFDEVFN